MIREATKAEQLAALTTVLSLLAPKAEYLRRGRWDDRDCRALCIMLETDVLPALETVAGNLRTELREADADHLR